MQNQAMRKILRVFKTALIILIEIESALPLPNIRLNYSNRRYAFWVLKLSQNHPIRAKFDQLIAKRSKSALFLGSDLSILDLPS